MPTGDRPALLLDVLGTVVHDPFVVEVPRALGLPLEEVLRLKHPTAWIEFELGDLTEEEFLPRFFADGRAYDQRGLVDTMRGGYRFLDGMEALLGELAAAGVRPHFLSNYPVWYRLIDERLELRRFADWSFVSCETRRRKPDPEAYLHAVRSLERAPSDCVFVDDVERNVAAAARLGLRAVRFTGAAELRAALVRSRLLQ